MAFFREPDRSRFSSVDEEIAPAGTEMATRIRSGTATSIRSQPMMFLPGSTNSASIRTYSIRFDGR